jgi:hypothetical protein
VRGGALVTVAVVVARVVAAQAPSAPAAAFEARVDAIVASRVTTTHFGLGLTRSASRNLELSLALGGGVTVRDGQDEAAASGRADVLARFAPLPANPNRWSAYAAGGVSALVERGARGRAVLVLIVGARGRRALVEAGLGGGLRLGAGVRF